MVQGNTKRKSEGARERQSVRRGGGEVGRKETSHNDRASANFASEMAAPALRQHGAIILPLQMCFICLGSRQALDQHGIAYPNTLSRTHTHIYAKIIVQFNSGHSQRRRFS